MHLFIAELKNMSFKLFRFGLLLRVVLIFITLIVAALMFCRSYYYSTAILFVLSLALLFELIRMVEHTNKKLNVFLQCLKNDDYTPKFTGYERNKTFRELNKSLNTVVETIKQIRSVEQEHFNYLQTIVQHINIGIIVYNRKGEVQLYNNPVKRLLALSSLKNIEELRSIGIQLPEELLNIRPGQSHLLKAIINNELFQIVINATEFRIKKDDYMLISLQNIHPELEDKEIESWQKLTRVLTHEIMNSITPVSSLASSVRTMVFNDDKSLRDFESDDLENIYSALNTIESRTQGLLAFVNSYRNLTRIPKPNFRYFEVKELFERVLSLLHERMKSKGIECEVNVNPSTLKITADPDLLEQVLINLLINASDAIEGRENGKITISAFFNSKAQSIIEVSDNGSGIKQDILEQIFLPFFTSKPNGSGIGLSLSRQIIHMHKGRITVRSVPDKGSTFTIIL